MRRVAGGPILLHIKFSYWKLQITNFTLYENQRRQRGTPPHNQLQGKGIQLNNMKQEKEDIYVKSYMHCYYWVESFLNFWRYLFLLYQTLFWRGVEEKFWDQQKPSELLATGPALGFCCWILYLKIMESMAFLGRNG